MASVVNRLGRCGGWERGELTREIAEDHQIGSCYGLRGVNLVVWMEVLMVETEKGMDFKWWW